MHTAWKLWPAVYGSLLSVARISAFTPGVRLLVTLSTGSAPNSALSASKNYRAPEY